MIIGKKAFISKGKFVPPKRTRESSKKPKPSPKNTGNKKSLELLRNAFNECVDRMKYRSENLTTSSSKARKEMLKMLSLLAIFWGSKIIIISDRKLEMTPKTKKIRIVCSVLFFTFCFVIC